MIYTPDARSLYVYGYQRYHVDEFPLVFSSCITLYFSGVAKDSGCRNSTVFRAKISNPCINTDIETQPVPNKLRAMITTQDKMDLSVTSGWEWKEHFTVDGVRFDNKCKPFTVQIFDLVTLKPVDNYLTFNQATGLMTLHPQLDAPVGV